MSLIPHHSVQIIIAGKPADGLTSRLRFLLSVRRLRSLKHGERVELTRLLSLAEIGKRHDGGSNVSH